jgi:hypothetical protein
MSSMSEVSTTTETWIQRVDAWRASGERAETFSRREGYAASTLRWWSSKLKRDLVAPVPAKPALEVRLARVIRDVQPTPAAAHGYAITLEVAGVRVGVAADADRATLAMVLDVLGVGR